MQYILNRSYCLDTNTNIDVNKSTIEIDKIELVIENTPMFWFLFSLHSFDENFVSCSG